ncbi:MAG: plastocyanin/azurin family copper-binding protein [Balneolaceae bacterium]
MNRFSKYLSLFTLVFLIAACGGNGTEEQPASEAAPADDGVRTIDVIGIDMMRFVVASDEEGITVGEQHGNEYELLEINASPGEELRINLEVRSQIPATAMSHNFAILDLGTDVGQFINQSAAAADNEYIAVAFEEDIIVTTRMLGGGESDSIQLTVPDEPGEYTFVCSFPGHYGAGMRGVLIVE